MRVPVCTTLFALALSACSTGTPVPENPTSPAAQGSLIAGYAERPELQDADTQRILARYADDPGMLRALQLAYGEASETYALPTTPPDLHGQSAARLAYVKSVGWGTVANYNGQYATFAGTGQPYSGLDWSRDGCSAPDGLGLGYRDTFRPACNVHDFAYRNLKVFERTAANRLTSDEVFRTNMNAICAARSLLTRPACYSAAYAYYGSVRQFGGDSF